MHTHLVRAGATTLAATLLGVVVPHRWLDRLAYSLAAFRRGAVLGCLACGSAFANDAQTESEAAQDTHFHAVTRAESGFAHDSVSVWLRRGPASVGVGIGMPTYVLSAPGQTSLRMLPASTPAMSLGMRYRISDRSRMYFDADLHSQPVREAGSTERPLRLGMEFKSAPVPALGLAQGALLRTQLSATSNLSLRMRRGGVSVVLRAQF